METNVGPLCRGPVWMPITPKRGSFLHAESHRGLALSMNAKLAFTATSEIPLFGSRAAEFSNDILGGLAATAADNLRATQTT